MSNQRYMKRWDFSPEYAEEVITILNSIGMEAQITYR